MTSVRQIRSESNPSGKYAYEIKLGACARKKKKKTDGSKQILMITRVRCSTHISSTPSCGAKRMVLLFVPADLGAAENECRRRHRHQRMQVEQHRREMNVASNLAGLINKNNPARSQNIPPYGRACMSAGSSIPLPLVHSARPAHPFLPG